MDDRAKLFRRLLEQRGVSRGPVPAIRQRVDGALGSQSMQQRAVFLHAQLQRDSSVYNLGRQVRIEGLLDEGAFHRAIFAVVDRHQVLRTTYEAHDGALIQQIRPASELQWDVVLLDHLAGPVAEQRVTRECRQAIEKPFDLAQELPIRTRLFRLAPDRHVWLLVVHHIASDGESMRILYRETGALYNALASGAPSPLPPLDIQYVDFAEEQQARWTTGAASVNRAYWRQRLEPAPPVLKLFGGQGAAGTADDERGALHAFCLPANLRQRLEHVAADQGTTLFVVLLTAFKAVLAACSGERDIVVSAAISSRTHHALESLIGLFAQMLPLRTKLGVDSPVAEIVGHVHKTLSDAYLHADVPLDEIVQASSKRLRNRGDVAWLQVAFTADTQAGEHLELDGLSIQSAPIAKAVSRFELSVALQGAGGALEGAIEYRTSMYSAAQIVALGSLYTATLTAVAENPAITLRDVERLHKAEKCGPPQSSIGRPLASDGRSVAELIVDQTRRRGEAIALSSADRAVSYAHLAACSARVAEVLIENGVGPDVRVGICLPRDVMTWVTFLGVLRSGGCYVPMDPSMPLERLKYVAADAGVRLVIATADMLERLAALDVPVLSLEHLLSRPGPMSTQSPDIGVRPANLAYVLYTSGSTGTPKGVDVTHQGLRNLVAWHHDEFRVTPADRAAQIARLTFDASGWEVWPYLAAGASVWVPDDDTVMSTPALHAWLGANAITCAFVPTPMVPELLEMQWADTTALRLLLTGGDRLRRRPGPSHFFAFVNNYGPTECSVVATSGAVEMDGGDARLPLLGRPIANARAYVLNPSGAAPVAGEPGELHIGGPSLARGYRGRPSLTAERFVPDPFSDVPGARMYRTGDMARTMADGTLEFLGRVDGQVKVRGQRIEPGEVERALLQQKGVREAAVFAESADNAERLIACVVPRPQADVSPGSVRAALRVFLPASLLPDVIVLLEALPLTGNGKIDYAALRQKCDGVANAAAEYVAPRNDEERALAEIWREVLGVRQVGVTDDFFELGGHSLTAMRVVGRIRAKLRVSLSARDVFEHPTVAQLAERLGGADRAQTPQPDDRIVAIRRDAVAASSAGVRIDPLASDAVHAAGLEDRHES